MKLVTYFLKVLVNDNVTQMNRQSCSMFDMYWTDTMLMRQKFTNVVCKEYMFAYLHMGL